MWISKKKYEEEKRRLEEENEKVHKDCMEILASANAVRADCNRLLSENMRLATLVNGQTEDCKIGPWCDGCKHKRETYGDIYDITQYKRAIWADVEEQIIRSKITICLKHIHELCPEFQSMEKGN